MASYRITFLPRTVKELRAVSNPRDRQAIENAIDSLAEEPRPHGCKKLQGTENQWRIRVGNFRVIYSIFDKQLIIEIIQIVNRRDAY